MLPTQRSRIGSFGSRLILVVLAVTTALAGCSDDDGPVNPIVDFAKLRTLHLSPDAGAIDVFANGVMVSGGLPFRAITDFIDVPVGVTDIAVAPSGQGLGSAVLNVSQNLVEDLPYTAVIYNTLSNIAGAVLLENLNTTPVPLNLVRIRIIHTASSLGEIDVWDLTAVHRPFATDMNLGDVGPYFEISPGAFTFGIDTNNDGLSDLTFGLPALAGGTVTNIFVVPDGPSVSMVAQAGDGMIVNVDQGTGPGPTQLRTLHLSPDAGPIDVFLNHAANATVSGLEYRGASPFTELVAGRYGLEVSPAGAGVDASVLRVPNLALAEGAFTTEVVYNTLDGIRALPLTENFDPHGGLRLRMVHTAAGAGEIDFWMVSEVASPTRLIENLGFGQAWDHLDLPQGAVKLGLDFDDNGTLDLVFQTPDFAAGTTANVCVVAEGANVFLWLHFEDGSTLGIGGEPIVPASIRGIHLSPDAGPLDAFLNRATAPIASAIAFEQGSNYVSIAAATYDIDLAPTGAGAGSAVLSIDDMPLVGGAFYTVAAYDNLGSIKELTLLDNPGDLAAGDIRFRVVHTATGVGQIDIWNVPAVGSPTPLTTDLDFGGVGTYADLVAGGYTLGVDLDDDTNPDLLFDLPVLPASTVANVFVVADGASVFLLVQRDNGSVTRIDGLEMGRIRALHLSPDAGTVDVFLNGVPTAAFTALDFPDGTAYLDVFEGAYSIDFAPTGAGVGASVANHPGLDVLNGGAYTAVAYDNLSTIETLAMVDSLDDVPDGELRIRAIHTAAGVGPVDIWNLPPSGVSTPLYTEVDFGEVGMYLDLPAGAYTLGVDLEENGTLDLVFSLPDLAAGTVANVFAVRETGGTVFLLAQFADGTTMRIDAEPPVGDARLRGLHLSPNAGTMDLFLNGAASPFLPGLMFELGSLYLDVPEGTYDLSFASGFSTANLPGIPLAAGVSYTAVAYNRLNTLTALALVDSLDGVPGGSIRVRAIHTAVGAGEVDIWIVPGSGSPSLLYPDLNLDSVGSYVELAAGAHTLGIDTDDNGTLDLVFDLPSLADGTVANLFVVAETNGTVFLFAQFGDGTTARIDSTPSAGNTNLRAIHLSPDTGLLDGFLNGAAIPAAADLPFEAGTAYASIPAGTYNLNFAPAGAGAGASVLDIFGLPLAVDATYTAVAFDSLSNIKALALIDDLDGVPPGNIRVRVAHTAAGVGQVDVLDVPPAGSPTSLFADVNFGGVTSYLEFAAGIYTLGIDTTDDGTPELSFTLPDLAEGTVVTVFAVESGGTVFLLAYLGDSTVVRIDAS